MEYYCAQRNNELEEFHVNWNDLQELMQSERSRTRRTLYTGTQLNVMDFSISSSAMTQDNSERLMRKNTIHIQRKNCGTRNAEEKNMIDYMVRWGYDCVFDIKRSLYCKYE